MIKEHSTCTFCGRDYYVDLNINDGIWFEMTKYKLTVTQSQVGDTNKRACPKCLGNFIQGYYYDRKQHMSFHLIETTQFQSLFTNNLKYLNIMTELEKKQLLVDLIKVAAGEFYENDAYKNLNAQDSTFSGLKEQLNFLMTNRLQLVVDDEKTGPSQADKGKQTLRNILNMMNEEGSCAALEDMGFQELRLMLDERFKNELGLTVQMQTLSDFKFEKKPE